MSTWRQQLRSNSVALISLTVALTSLSYNTWRNERTEHNRNVRTATFELLMKVAELQRVVYLAQYDRDERAGSPRNGWTDVLAIRDLAQLAPAPLPARADELLAVWRNNWEGLGRDEDGANSAVTRIDDAIGAMRQASLSALTALR